MDISQVEGFVRQILGWREYLRGVYWERMPQYASCNYFAHRRTLPGWYWSGHTRMNCLAHAIGQSLQGAYAHHIQRLMVTGAFALMAGVHPDEVDAWYLGIYIDAVQWVEVTNTRGMSQYADGGLVGTKPYTCSAAYISRMSDYCRSCRYEAKRRTGPGPARSTACTGTSTIATAPCWSTIRAWGWSTRASIAWERRSARACCGRPRPAWNGSRSCSRRLLHGRELLDGGCLRSHPSICPAHI